MMKTTLEDILKTATKAALIPTLPESKKEEKATSVLLAAFRIVPLFAKEIMRDASFPSVKKLKVECYTEINFDESNNSKNDKQTSRPDGLVVVNYSGRTWSALIESKIGNNEHDQEQIERYLDIAKEYEIDTVITISNQFASLPSHHPVKVNKTKLKNVDLYHFSWLSILAKAFVLVENSHVEDPEQAFIIEELIRYLDSKESGVTTLTRMSGAWKEVTQLVQQKTKLTKSSDDVVDAVASWQQLQRYLSLHLSRLLKEPVQQHMGRNRAQSAENHLKIDIEDLVSDNPVLSSEFNIPNAAARLKLEADFARRNITFSMKLEAPKDRKLATASFNWLTRQLKDLTDPSVVVWAHWPKRTASTQATFVQVKEDPTCLIPEGCKDIPAYLEIARVVDLAGKFVSVNKFVEIITKEVEVFYTEVGQELSPWTPKPPKMPVVEVEDLEEESV